MDGPVSSTVNQRLARIGSTCLLAAYAVALAIGTHTPLAPEELLQHISDKALHFLSYFGLGGLSGLRLLVYGVSRPSSWCVWFVMLCAAGGVDELTQPLVGRIADWLDWRADVVGVAVGLLVPASLWSLWQNRASRSARGDV